MIYLARHGQTVFNRETRLQGRIDSALTELLAVEAKLLTDLDFDDRARLASGLQQVLDGTGR